MSKSRTEPSGAGAARAGELGRRHGLEHQHGGRKLGYQWDFYPWRRQLAAHPQRRSRLSARSFDDGVRVPLRAAQ